MNESFDQINASLEKVKAEIAEEEQIRQELEQIRQTQEAEDQEKINASWKRILRREIGGWIVDHWKITGHTFGAYASLAKDLPEGKSISALISCCMHFPLPSPPADYRFLICFDDLCLEVDNLEPHQLSEQVVFDAIAFMILKRSDKAMNLFRRPDGTLSAKVTRDDLP